MSRRATPSPPRTSRRWLPIAIGVGVGIVGIAVVIGFLLLPQDPRSRREKAERAEEQGRWSEALPLYRRLCDEDPTRARNWLGLGRSLLALDHAREAESALRRAAESAPTDPQAWHLLLEIFRLERRGVDILRTGEEALKSVSGEDRKALLRDITLGLLFQDISLDLPAEQRARETLSRWLNADPADNEARAALALRQSIDPLPEDPVRVTTIADLQQRLAEDPQNAHLREALIVNLADVGEIDQGRNDLDSWPEAVRDVRYDRLRARWDLEYDHNPAAAIQAALKVLASFPHDWKSRYRLARALKMVGRENEAATESEEVTRLRERLEPGSLSTRLARDLAKLDDPGANQDIADLCAAVGLTRWAEAWAAEASRTRLNSMH